MGGSATHLFDETFQSSRIIIDPLPGIVDLDKILADDHTKYAEDDSIKYYIWSHIL